MLDKTICCLLMLTTLGFSGLSHAGYVTQGSLKVQRVQVGYAGGVMYFSIDKAPKNPRSCKNTSSSNRLVAVDPSKSEVSQVLAVLLSAQATKSSVELQIFDDTCLNDFAVLRRIAVY